MKNFAILLCFAIFLAGCLGGSAFSKAEVAKPHKWTPYIENDGSLSAVAFYSENLAKTNALESGSVIGIALRKSGDNAVKIGNLYVIDGFSFIVIDQERSGGHHYVNMYDKADLKRLYGSKSIKFYTFGKGTAQSAVYSSKDGSVCENFHANKPVSFRGVTNYYDPRVATNDQFATSIMQTFIQKDKDVNLPKVEYKFYPDKQTLAEFVQVVDSGKFDIVLQKDLKKQERVLNNIICVVK